MLNRFGLLSVEVLIINGITSLLMVPYNCCCFGPDPNRVHPGQKNDIEACRKNAVILGSIPKSFCLILMQFL